MKTYRFEMGATVRVKSSGKDPGGVGVVTARENKEDDRGEQILYRVRIEGHKGQEDGAKEKGRRNDGFWYKDELVGAA